VTTRLALWIVGGAALALALYYAFGAHAGAAANSAGLTASSPPPQPVAGSSILTSQVRRLGIISQGGRNFFR
jgi:hypothetical protein